MNEPGGCGYRLHLARRVVTYYYCSEVLTACTLLHCLSALLSFGRAAAKSRPQPGACAQPKVCGLIVSLRSFGPQFANLITPDDYSNVFFLNYKINLINLKQ